MFLLGLLVQESVHNLKTRTVPYFGRCIIEAPASNIVPNRGEGCNYIMSNLTYCQNRTYNIY